MPIPTNSEFQKYSKDRVTAARSIPVTPEFQAQYLLVRESLPLPKWVSRWGLKKIEPSEGHDTRALQAYLGHKNIQHTVRYTELSPTRFKDFWRDEGARQ
jgi:hypothetical protein